MKKSYHSMTETNEARQARPSEHLRFRRGKRRRCSSSCHRVLPCRKLSASLVCRRGEAPCAIRACTCCALRPAGRRRLLQANDRDGDVGDKTIVHEQIPVSPAICSGESFSVMLRQATAAGLVEAFHVLARDPSDPARRFVVLGRECDGIERIAQRDLQVVGPAAEHAVIAGGPWWRKASRMSRMTICARSGAWFGSMRWNFSTPFGRP